MIAPYFPPMGVVGAKRALHLVRNLPAFGWDAVVLAADPRRENQDASLGAAVPASVPVSYRYDAPFRRLGRRAAARPAVAKPKPREARVTIRGRDLPLVWPFDPYLADAPWATREALRLVREHDARAVHVCADPFSAFFVGMEVARRTALPLVLDLRDPWSLHPGRAAMRPWATRAVIEWVERAAFRAAAKVVLNTEDALAAYRARYAGVLPAERFTAIRNAFDLELFASEAGPTAAAPVPGAARGTFVVLHFGYFRRFVPSLPLLEGFAGFVRDKALAPGQALLRCVGGLRAEDEREVARLGLGAFVEARPAVPYAESFPLLRAADVLAVVVEPRMGLCVPAKVYDYVGARRPILAITDNPEVERIVRSALGEVAPLGDGAAVAAALGRLWDEPRTPPEGAVEPFTARTQARKMAAVLDEVTRPR